jgi:hypothetical protein
VSGSVDGGTVSIYVNVEQTSSAYTHLQQDQRPRIYAVASEERASKCDDRLVKGSVVGVVWCGVVCVVCVVCEVWCGVVWRGGVVW